MITGAAWFEGAGLPRGAGYMAGCCGYGV